MKLSVRKAMEETRKELIQLNSNTMGKRKLRWTRKPGAAMDAGLLFSSCYIGSVNHSRHLDRTLNLCAYLLSKNVHVLTHEMMMVRVMLMLMVVMVLILSHDSDGRGDGMMVVIE